MLHREQGALKSLQRTLSSHPFRAERLKLLRVGLYANAARKHRVCQNPKSGAEMRKLSGTAGIGIKIRLVSSFNA